MFLICGNRRSHNIQLENVDMWAILHAFFVVCGVFLFYFILSYLYVCVSFWEGTTCSPYAFVDVLSLVEVLPCRAVTVSFRPPSRVHPPSPSFAMTAGQSASSRTPLAAQISLSRVLRYRVAFFVLISVLVVACRCFFRRTGVLEPRLGQPGPAPPAPGRLAGQARQPGPPDERRGAGDVLQPPRRQEGAPHGALVGARGVQQREGGC